jgi:hypothetical protein
MIANLMIGAFERSLGEDAGYMRDIAAVSGKAFRGFVRLSRFAGYHRHAAGDLVHLARLGAMTGEDCGPCLRIAFKMAKRDGVAEPLLRAALAGGYALSGDQARAFFFGRSISTGDVMAADELGGAIEAAHGRKVRTELALAAATTRVFPAVKRGLGYARSCALTRFEDL